MIGGNRSIKEEKQLNSIKLELKYVLEQFDARKYLRCGTGDLSIHYIVLFL